MDQGITDPHATREATQRQARAAADTRRREKNDLRRVMSSDFGRRFVHRMVERSGVFRLSVEDGNEERTHRTAFNEGRRNEGLRLLLLLMQACPTEWQTALREHEDWLAQQRQDQDDDQESSD